MVFLGRNMTVKLVRVIGRGLGWAGQLSMIARHFRFSSRNLRFGFLIHSACSSSSWGDFLTASRVESRFFSNLSHIFFSFLIIVLNELDASPYSRQIFFFFPCLTSSKTSTFLATKRRTRVDNIRLLRLLHIDQESQSKKPRRWCFLHVAIL